MNAIKYFYSACLMLLVLAACKKVNTDDVSFVDAAAAPAKLSVMFDITQDNTGKVTITPNGEGAIFYDVYYGDASTTPANLSAGKNTIHTYAEGVYNVKIVAHAVNGKTTELIQKLTVSFRAPENLAVTVAIDAANNFKVNVSATALYETFFKVFWGDVANEPGQSFLEGQTVSHVYAAVGTYTVKVVAYSGGAATTTYTTTVNIVDPVLLPITFESPTVNYAFTNFGGGVATKIANPQINGINTSANVGRMVKGAPEVYGGSLLTLGGPIDFSANRVFRMKVFSPRVGAKVLLKALAAAVAERRDGRRRVAHQPVVEGPIGPRPRHHTGSVARADARLVGVDQHVQRGRVDVALLRQHGFERANTQVHLAELAVVAVRMRVVVVVGHAHMLSPGRPAR